MNVESANLSPLLSNGSAVEAVMSPLIDGGQVSEGFTDALVTQIQLLSDAKTETLLSVPVTAVSGLQTSIDQQAVISSPVDKTDVQNFAALLGNDLPVSYKTKDEADHAAALALVKDTLKYVAAATGEEKAAEVEQNIANVMAMAGAAIQNTKDVGAAAVVPVGQGMRDEAAVVVAADQSVKDALAMAVSVEPSTVDVAAETGQDVENAEAPVQMDLGGAKDKVNKKQSESEAQQEDAEDNQEDEGLSVAAVFISVMPIVQANPVNNSVSVDAIKEEALLSFMAPSAEAVKLNVPSKVPENMSRSETVSLQSVQDKQGFNVKYFDNGGQIGKFESVAQQTLSSEEEKTVPRIGADNVATLNKSIIENKADVPAITKPLSHPDWNKDLGQRIVWMSGKAIPAAEIRLNPEHLGPISVRVNVADDQATVSFTAQHATTRDAIEASIPKLREMMSAQQLNLADVNISQGSASDQGRSQSQNFAQTADGRGQQGDANTVIDGGLSDDVEQEIDSGRAVVSKGLLSLYA